LTILAPNTVATQPKRKAKTGKKTKKGSKQSSTLLQIAPPTVFVEMVATDNRDQGKGSTESAVVPTNTMKEELENSVEAVVVPANKKEELESSVEAVVAPVVAETLNNSRSLGGSIDRSSRGRTPSPRSRSSSRRTLQEGGGGSSSRSMHSSSRSSRGKATRNTQSDAIAQKPNDEDANGAFLVDTTSTAINIDHNSVRSLDSSTSLGSSNSARSSQTRAMRSKASQSTTSTTTTATRSPKSSSPKPPPSPASRKKLAVGAVAVLSRCDHNDLADKEKVTVSLEDDHGAHESSPATPRDTAAEAHKEAVVVVPSDPSAAATNPTDMSQETAETVHRDVCDDDTMVQAKNSTHSATTLDLLGDDAASIVRTDPVVVAAASFQDIGENPHSSDINTSRVEASRAELDDTANLGVCQSSGDETPKRQQRRMHSDLAKELDMAMNKVWAKFEDQAARQGTNEAALSRARPVVGRRLSRGLSMMEVADDVSIDDDLEDMAYEEEVLEEVLHNDAVEALEATIATIDTNAKTASWYDQLQRVGTESPTKEVVTKGDATDDEMTMASTVTGSYSSNPVPYIEFSGDSNANASGEKKSKESSGILLPNTGPEQGEDSWSLTEPALAAAASVVTPNDSRLPFLPKLLVVDMWSDSTSEVLAALDQFASLSASKSNVDDFLKHGGHLSLIAAMRKWPLSSAIQAAGLWAMHKAAEMMEFSDAVVQLGALDLVLVAMKNHSAQADVVTAGCAALLNLTVSAAHAKTLVFEFQGIPVICSACATFPTNTALQKYAVYIIQYFSYWEDFQAPIVKAGGLQTLQDMVESVTASKQRQENADSVLKSAKATMKRLM
jgi:hypothetical protein